MYERKLPLKKINGIDVTFLVVGGKWKRDIILSLNNGLKRPSELQKHLKYAGASSRVLRQALKDLETFGVVYKVAYPVMPLKVEYFLTELGKECIPLFEIMNDWGNKYERINKKNVALAPLYEDANDTIHSASQQFEEANEKSAGSAISVEEINRIPWH